MRIILHPGRAGFGPRALENQQRLVIARIRARPHLLQITHPVRIVIRRRTIGGAQHAFPRVVQAVPVGVAGIQGPDGAEHQLQREIIGRHLQQLRIRIKRRLRGRGRIKDPGEDFGAGRGPVREHQAEQAGVRRFRILAHAADAVRREQRIFRIRDAGGGRRMNVPIRRRADFYAAALGGFCRQRRTFHRPAKLILHGRDIPQIQRRYNPPPRTGRRKNHPQEK